MLSRALDATPGGSNDNCTRVTTRLNAPGVFDELRLWKHASSLGECIQRWDRKYDRFFRT